MTNTDVSKVVELRPAVAMRSVPTLIVERGPAESQCQPGQLRLSSANRTVTSVRSAVGHKASNSGGPHRNPG